VKSIDKQCNTKTLQQMFRMSAFLWNACPQPNSPLINNNNNNPICKAPECQKTSVALDHLINDRLLDVCAGYLTVDILHKLSIDSLL